MAWEAWNTRSRRLSYSILCGLILGLLSINSVSSGSPCDPRRQFSCKNHPSICIPKSQVRDGVANCPDASDEECPSTMHRCLCGIPRCIERRLVGDGIRHCLDGSDEGEDDINFLCPDATRDESSSTDETRANRNRRQAGLRRDQVVYPTGIISAFTGTEVNGDRTTLHRTELHRTYLDGSYAQVLHSTSSILPTPTYDGRNQDGLLTTHLGVVNEVENFGSLSSGKVYLTAVSEPVSSLSSTVLSAPHTNSIYGSTVSSSLGSDDDLDEVNANKFSTPPVTTITGSIIPYSGEVVTKRLILDVSARTVGTSYPENTGNSIISVTGTQGRFVQHDELGDKTYSIFTGSYVSGSEQPTTYVFFFGNSPLTSEVRVVLPTKTSGISLKTINRDRSNSEESGPGEFASEELNNVETKLIGSNFESGIHFEEGRDDINSFFQLGSLRRMDDDNKGSQFIDYLTRRSRRDEDEVANRFGNGDTYGSEDATPIYDNEQPLDVNVLASESRKPIAITRYIQPTSSRSKSAYILTDSSANEKVKVVTAQAFTLRGHPNHSRKGRMHQPSSVAGRRVQGSGGATIITDQFFFASDAPHIENTDLHDEAFYEDAAIRIGGQDLSEEFRKLGGIGRFIFPSKSSFSDRRITKTVGLYGPIYDIDYETNKADSAVEENSTLETAVYHSNHDENDTLGGKTITLFGFAEFSTKISGTNYIFMPASTLPRTFTPRVTRTNFFRGTASSSTKASHETETDVFFRQPLYGTETREFVSQMSMFTSTVKDPIELQKTMITVTVATKQPGEERSRIGKLGEEAVLEEMSPSRLSTTPFSESPVDKDYSINIENLQKSNAFLENSMDLDITEIMDDVPEFNDKTMPAQPTGLLSSITGTEVGNGMTTHWTTLIFGTYVDDTYAHIIQSTSSIFYTITKTATPEGVLYETSEAQDGLYDNVIKSEFVDTQGNSQNSSIYTLSPSLNDISSSFFFDSVQPTDDLSATSPVQILTSGFFLPHGNNNNDMTKSLIKEEISLHSEYNQDETKLRSAAEDEPEFIRVSVTPGVLYADNSSDESEEESTENEGSNVSTTQSLQILTDGFILPIVHENIAESPIAVSNVILTSHTIPPSSTDGIKSSDTSSTLQSSNENLGVSLEEYINNRSGLVPENEKEISNDSHDDSENDALSAASDTLRFDSISSSNSTDIYLDTASENMKEETINSFDLDASLYMSSVMSASILPTVVYADDSDLQYASPSIVLLTGDFILPRKPTNENDDKKDSELKESTRLLRPSILTDGFIFPGAPEKIAETVSENQVIPSSKLASDIHSVEPLSILTAGFILPGKIQKNEGLEPQNSLPSSELLTADFFSLGTDNVVEKDPIISTPEARSVGDATNYVITDGFILPTPTEVSSRSNAEGENSYKEDDNRKAKTSINGDAVEAILNLSSEKSIESSNPREGKAIKLSHENHGATRVEELLPSISYPITYYTTSTYFTTFLLEGSTVVSSREETISQVYTDSDHLSRAQVKRTHTEDRQQATQILRPSKSQDFSTAYTTVTYYKTLIKDGSVVVTSSEETKSRIVHATETPPLLTKTSYPVSTYPTTYYTTLTYFTTLLRDGSSSVITSKTVMSNVVSSTDEIRKITTTSNPTKPIGESTHIGSKPTTYYTTYTYYTTFLRDGETSVNTRLHTVSNVAYGTLPSSGSDQITTALRSTTSTSLHETLTKVKPTTYFTTYTYYTTYLRGDKTIVSSREEVISSVVGARTTSPSRVESTKAVHSTPPSPLKTTFYTTYTYYTTFLRDGTTTVSAREETVTNIKSDHSAVGSDVKPVKAEYTSHSITPTPTTVKTYYTTYTYFTTFLRNGTPVVSSRESTTENVVTQEKHSSVLPSSVVSTVPTRVFSTYYTTLTSYFTLFKEGTPSVSTVFSTLTDVVALSTPDHKSLTENLRTSVKSSPVTTTYTTVFTYYTTHFSEGTPVISSREETRTNVIILPTAKTTSRRLTTIVHAVTPFNALPKEDSVATSVPTNVVKTYYTTYSYFTTFLHEGSPTVSTRYETIKSYETKTPGLGVKLSHSLNTLTAVTNGHDRTGLQGSLNTETTGSPSILFSPVTHYTTYTYYTTQLKDGSPIVNSRTQVVSSIMPHISDNRHLETHILSTKVLQDTNRVSISKPYTEISTLFTTYTFYTTLFPEGSPVIKSRMETVTNTVTATINPSSVILKETKTKTDLDAAEGEFFEKRVQPNAVVTYFSTHTYLTTSIQPNGETQFLTRKVTASAIVSPEASDTNEKIGISLPQEPRLPPVSSSLIECCNENSKNQHTVYTTYTFYTTRYDGATPVVTTRFEKITNVIDQNEIKTLLHISPNKTIVNEHLSSSESENIFSSDYQPSSPRKPAHSEQRLHVRLVDEENSYVQPPPVTESLPTTVFKENNKLLNDSEESTIMPSPVSITDQTGQISEEKNNTNVEMEYSEEPVTLSEEESSTIKQKDSETTGVLIDETSSPGKSGETTTPVDSPTTTQSTNEENSKDSLDTGKYPGVASNLTAVSESSSNVATTILSEETTSATSALEETTKMTSAVDETTTPSEETTTTTLETPRRGIFSRRRNRPTYRPRPTTRSTTSAPTTSSTTTSPRTPAPFTRRNTSRLLFRRPSTSNRTFPLRRLRISRPLDKANEPELEAVKDSALARKKRSDLSFHHKEYENFPKLRKLLNARDEDVAIKNNDLRYPYSKHDHSGIVIRSAYEENSSPKDYRMSPIQNSNDLYPTGLIRSLEAKAVNNGITTVYATEIHGTYINGAYAQVVQSSTKVLSDTSNEIDRTSLVMPSVPIPTTDYSSTSNHQKVGLVSSQIHTSVNDGRTTIYTTNIYGTYVGNVYAHIAQTFSSIVSPTPTASSQYSTGLISSSLRSEIRDGSTIMWTTHIYGTFVNGYYAHIASTFSNVYGPQTKKVIQPTLLPSGFNNHIYAHATPDINFASSKHSNSANVENQPRRIDQDKTHSKQEHKVGLLSSFVSNLVWDGTTTEYITNIYGTYVGQQYAQHMQTTSRILLPKPTETQTRSVGLLSTMLNSVVNENTATLYKTEIYGTYIGQHYAQIARTSTETRILPSKTVQTVASPVSSQRTGLITTSVIRSEVVQGTTTLHLNEIYGTYIGSAYAHVAKSTSRIIQNTVENNKISHTSSQNVADTSAQKTGLVSSKVSTEINDGTTTLHISEIHGTYIGSYYAHIARRTSTVLPFITPSSAATLTTTSQGEGIVSSVISTEINYGTTTLHTREIYGTTINGFYAHIARSTSNVITPTSSSIQPKTSVAGLVSVITNSVVNGGALTLYTTEIFGTTINGFYAHVARSTSTVITASSSEKPVQPTGLISVTTSTEINNGISTVYETSLIGSEVNGHYVQAVKSTSHVIYGSKPYEEDSTKPSVPEVDVRPTLPANADRDFLDTARVNQLDSDNHHEHFSTGKHRNLATPVSLPSYYDILSPSFNSDNVLDIENSQTATPNIPLQLRTQSESTHVESASTLSPLPFLTESLSGNEATGESLNDKISSLQMSSVSEDLIDDDDDTTPMEDENEDDYNDYCDDEKSCKFKDTRTTKSNRGDQEEKRRASTRPPPKKSRNENDYDEYDFDDDYEEYEKKKDIGKHLSTITPSRDRSSRTSRLRNSQQDPRKTTKTPYTERDYDDYEDEYDDEQSSYQTSTESSESQSTKEQPTNSVRIRPFAGRGRPTFTTPIRTTTKPSFTIQFRRPSRVRNSRAFGQRSDSENNHDFDDDLENEEEEGDIEASEAVVTSATPQVLPFRRKTFGSQRYQPLTRSSSTSTTTTSRPPLILNRNRRLFGRASSASPSSTTSPKDNVSDYVENTTEDDEFENYDDIEEKDEGNGGQRGLRLTRRPSSRFSRTYGERRSPSIKRGTFRQREDEEVENDDIDSTTPDYRSSRNNRHQRKQGRGRLNQNRSPSLKTSFNSVNRDEDEDPHSLQPINRLRNNNRRRQHSYNPRTRRPTKTATETQTTVKKPHLTVTSVVTTVKTLPIYHGFRTSYATLTTTALDTSIINPSQYSTVVNDGLTKTLVFSKVGLPDGLENFYTTVTEVVITTTSLASVKLVPIKIGFSTRTDTVTDIQVLTTLSTMYSTISPDTPTPTAFPQQFQPPFFPQIGPQNQDFGLFNSPNSFVTTQLVTSTTVIPVVLRGRTILSTLTTTSTAESTVVQTANIRVPQVPSAAPFIPQPYFAFQPITTQITVYVTGEYGELKPVVTTVTVPLYQQPVFHTKVARSLQSAPTEQPIISTELPKLGLKTSMNDDSPQDLEIDTHYDKLLSSGLEEINDISEVVISHSKTEPLESTVLTKSANDYNSADVTTILKGPLTEIYEQKATVNIDLNSIHNEIEHTANRASEKFGIESSYNFRKLQQFSEDDDVDFRPQHEFTRLRRPAPEITRSTVVNNIQTETRSPETLFSHRPSQIGIPRRRPGVEVFTEGTAGQDVGRGQPRDVSREAAVVSRRPQRPSSNYRPFVRRPPSFVRDETDVRNLPSFEAQPPQPGLNDLDQINGLIDASGVSAGGVSPSNSFSGSPSLEEASRNGFRPLIAPPPSTNENGQSPQTNVQVRPVRLRVIRPAQDSVPPNNSNVRRITKTRTINPTHTTSVAVAENELESTVDVKPSENVEFTTHEPRDDKILPLLTPSLTADKVSENSDLENSYEDESLANSNENNHDSTGVRRTVVRRLRPSFVPGDGRGARRPIVVRRTRFSTLEISESSTTGSSETDVEPSTPNTPQDASEVRGILSVSSQNPANFGNEEENEYLEVTTPSSDTKPLRKVIRLRKPEGPLSGQNLQRRRVIITKRPTEQTETTGVRGRGPVLVSNTLDDRHKYNLLTDDTALSRNREHSSVSNDQVYEMYSTKPLPFTYYTTLTYFTTFVRGTDVIYASREDVFSNTIQQVPNPSLISVIQNNNGRLSDANENQIVHLASRILGDTTTLVNLASKQNVYNSEIYSLLKESNQLKIVATSKPAPSMLAKDLLATSGSHIPVSLDTSNINAVASLPKTYVTLFTYFYTFYDGNDRRQSTRAETITNVAVDPTQFLSESIGTYINEFGYLTVGPSTKVVNLGSRNVEGTTTEVNLGLKTLVHFSGLRNVILESNKFPQYITPSRTTILPKTKPAAVEEVLLPSFETTREGVLTSSLLQPSYVSANELFNSDTTFNGVAATPLIPYSLDASDNNEVEKSREPFLRVTSVIHKPSGSLRSGVFTPRPGVRVRVRPVVPRRPDGSNLPETLPPGYSDHSAETLSELVLSDTNKLDFYNSIISTPAADTSYVTAIAEEGDTSNLQDNGKENELTSEEEVSDEDGEKLSDGAGHTRKRLKITVRRPQSGSVSRTHTRFVLPSRFEITSKPRFYVVTRTGALGVVSPSQRPFTVKISRKLKSSVTEDGEIAASTTVVYDTYTTLTTVPVIFGLDTSFRNVLLTTSSPVTVTHVSPSYEEETPGIQPSHTVVLTYFTTTTFTIPYTIGDETLYTTLEETNSRIVTTAFDGLDSLTYSTITRTTEAPDEGTVIPSHAAITSLEFGFGGPTTHILSSGIDGSRTKSVIYPPGEQGERATKIVLTDPEGVELTSIYGSVPAEKDQTSVITIGTLEDMAPQSSQSVQPILTPEATTVLYDTQTFFTTYTFFTTFFTGTDSFISSYEQVVSNVITVPITRSIIPTSSPNFVSELSSVPSLITVFDTSEYVTTTTSYKTVTFYATLFNDTMSFVTPIEEVQTETGVITETYTITKTIVPTPIMDATTILFTPSSESESSVVLTQTLYTTYTNFVTLFQGTDTVVSNLEEVVSNVVTLTVPASDASTLTFSESPLSTKSSEISEVISTPHIPVYTTREVLSTQTHYLTIFDGDEKILSSLEEVVTSFVTEIASPEMPSETPELFLTSTFVTPETVSTELFTPFTTQTLSIEPTTEVITEEIETYQPELVPSIRTIYSTLTFYTTYFSDTSSIVATQEEVLTSYVTLFVPPSLITSTSSEDQVITSTPEISTSTSTEQVFVFTTTDYSTLTLYTTLFSGDETVVISSEQVIPEIITATITPSSTSTLQSTPSAESVLTFLTTFTYYTTYFSGADAVIASSESVVTQFVTIEAAPTFSSPVTSTDFSTSVTPEDETILGFSIASGGDISSSFKDDIPEGEIIGVVTAVSSSVATETEQPHIAETSVVTEVSSAVQMETEMGTQVYSHVTSTVIKKTASTETSLASKEHSPSHSTEGRSHEGRGINTDGLLLGSSSATISGDSSVILFTGMSSSKTPDLPVTSSSIITETTEIIGVDGKITTLLPSATLMLVTGTDGFVTKLSEASVSLSSPSDSATPVNASQISSEIKPATVIELTDLLGGNTAFGGDIGLAIQDIVSLITGKKNKTEGESILPETTTQDSTTVEDTDESEKAAIEIHDSTTDSTTVTESSSSSSEEADTTKETYRSTEKEVDYPIFIRDTPKSNTTSYRADVPTPVYIPSPKIGTLSREVEINSTGISSMGTRIKSPSLPSRTFNTSDSHDVTTSVITGIRTIFLQPSIASSRSGETVLTSSLSTVDSSDEVMSDIMSSKTETETLLTTAVMDDEVKNSTTPYLSTSIETSIVTGVRTIFFGTVDSLPHEKTHRGTPTRVVEATKDSGLLDATEVHSDSKFDASTSSTLRGRANDDSTVLRAFTTVTKDGQTIVSRTTSGATTIFFPAQLPKASISTPSTRFITSVESITRTLALTTTRTYYTRDSTLTVPSVYTTTIPPRTFVSTIIGTRTILGILPEPTESIQIHQTSAPTERTTTVTTTTLIFNSIPSTVVRTLVLPTRIIPASTSSSSESSAEASVFSAGTEKPAKPPEVADSTSLVTSGSDANDPEDTKTPLQKARDETYLRAAGPRLRDYQLDVRAENEIVRPPIVITEANLPEHPFSNKGGVCDPSCQPHKKEMCKETDGQWTCQCRPGHARKDSFDICAEVQTYVVLLKVLKMGNATVDFNNAFTDTNSEEFREFTKAAKEGISEMYQYTSIRDHYLGSDVNEIIPADMVDGSNVRPGDARQSGVVVNFTVQVSPNINKNLLEQELTRSLQLADQRVGASLLTMAPLSQSVRDFDECQDLKYNDCSSNSVCENLPGSYTCACLEGFEDMDSKLPGRTCLAKTENCEYCHSRGDCLEKEEGKIFCRCLPMFIGRRCEINGLVLAIALPTAVAVVVMLLCGVVFCCRRCRRKSPKSDSSGMFRGIALRGPVGGTLDRKAMIDTSSESSGEHGIRNSQAFDGYQESGDVTPKKGSKKSDLSLDRSLSTGYTVPPVMIPRARQHQPHNKMNYAVYNGQVYVW